MASHQDDHDHHHHHDHDHGSELSETQLRVRALETVLTEKGYIDPAALDAIVEAYETQVGPHRGLRGAHLRLRRSGLPPRCLHRRDCLGDSRLRLACRRGRRRSGPSTW